MRWRFSSVCRRLVFVDFGSGTVMLAPNPLITEAAVAACQNPRFLSYLPPAGMPELREAIATEAGVSSQNVLVTSGAKHSLFSCLFQLLEPGDEVLLCSPVWPVMVEMVSSLGGSAVLVSGGSDQPGARLGGRPSAMPGGSHHIT